MSLIWADIPDRSVGIYNTATGITTDGLYAQFSLGFYDDPDPAIGSAGKVMGQEGGSGDRVVRWILPATRTEVGMGCRVYVPNVPIEADRAVAVHQYLNAVNSAIVTAVISPVGSIQIRSGNYEGTILAETAQDVIPANSWRHVETEITFNATTGTAKVWIEGVLVLNATGLNTGSAPCAQVGFRSDADSGNGRTTVYYKDIFIRDGEGSVNNDKIGPCTVYYRPPSSDISSGWTRSSGTEDFALLDDSPPVDTDYISADDTPPAASIMGMDDLPADVVAIRGIITVARALKTDSGDGNLQVSLSPNGTDWDTGADNAVSTTESFYHDVSELSPATANAWTPSEFNSARIRLDRTV